MNATPLHVIIPYFDHVNARVNRENLRICLRNLSGNPNILLTLAEGIYHPSSELPDLSGMLYRHLKFRLQNPIWVHQNLVNLALQSLGESWEFAAWIDKDIQFLNPFWDRETVRVLENADLAQPWSRVLFLGRDQDLELNGPVFGNFEGHDDPRGIMSFCQAKIRSFQKPGHTGNAWAIRKSFYRRIGKLFDLCIVGGGDTAMTAALNDRLDRPNLRVYGDLFREYAVKFEGARIGYAPGTIVHHFHGELENRRYAERYLMLEAGGFDPSKDLSYAENGTLRLSNPKLEVLIREFFLSRGEHLV
jgi:hypothetical protein